MFVDESESGLVGVRCEGRSPLVFISEFFSPGCYVWECSSGFKREAKQCETDAGFAFNVGNSVSSMGVTKDSNSQGDVIWRSHCASQVSAFSKDWLLYDFPFCSFIVKKSSFLWGQWKSEVECQRSGHKNNRGKLQFYTHTPQLGVGQRRRELRPAA